MKVVILGNGGHSKVIQEMITCKQEHKIIAILDDKYEIVRKEREVIYGPVRLLKKLLDWDVKIVVAIGNNKTRKFLVKKLSIEADRFLTVVHPGAVVSNTATVGYGTVVMPGACINAEAIIGEHAIINTGAIVEHEGEIGDYAHISPNATLTGNVLVGEGVHIGASTTIIPGQSIGDWAVVGAGSTVIRNIPANSKAVGCPTRILNKDQRKEKSVDKVVMLYEET